MTVYGRPSKNIFEEIFKMSNYEQIFVVNLIQ